MAALYRDQIFANTIFISETGTVARIVFAWELGSGFGHLAPIAALGQSFIHAGHQVAAVVPSATPARGMLEPLGIAVHELPFFSAPAHDFPISVNYSANLLRNGFWHSGTISQRLRAWQQQLSQLQPELLLCDHAPSALLASRSQRYSRAVMGTGFTVPPLATPMPGVQPWFTVPEAYLVCRDRQLLDAVNPALTELGLAELPNVAALFEEAQQFLTVEAELDHYQQRHEGCYWGSIEPSVAVPNIPPGDDGKPLVFVYLPGSNPFLTAVMTSLLKLDITVLAYIAGATSVDSPHAIISPNIRYLHAQIDLKVLAPRCQLAITHGGTQSAAIFLKQGVRLLCCPQDLEKAVFSQRLVERGLAFSANWFTQNLETLGQTIAKLVANHEQPPQLHRFAAQYGHRSASITLQQIVSRCEQWL